jgi:GNAT superfamily N-acetyltransferase
VLERGGEVLGYAIAHPWTQGSIPQLDTLLGALPDDADCLYLHDIAILPAARGHGSARDMVDRLAEVARARGLRALALTSVYGTQDFWSSCGFVAAPTRDMADKLASYGGPAIYMMRAV